MVPGLLLGAWALLSALFKHHRIDTLRFLIVLSTRILTLAIHPHLHLTVLQATTILSKGPSNHGFVPSMDSIRTTTPIPYPLLVVSQLPSCFQAL
jgi:hypothetical protein